EYSRLTRKTCRTLGSLRTTIKEPSFFQRRVNRPKQCAIITAYLPNHNTPERIPPNILHFGQYRLFIIVCQPSARRSAINPRNLSVALPKATIFAFNLHRKIAKRKIFVSATVLEKTVVVGHNSDILIPEKGDAQDELLARNTEA